MRQPLMTVLLLFLCFPVKGIVVMLAAAALGAAVPLPKALRAEQAEGLTKQKNAAAEGGAQDASKRRCAKATPCPASWRCGRSTRCR